MRRSFIFTLLAENGRQLRAVGKGARKPGSRLAARCEFGCKVDLLLAHGRSLDVVAEATLVEATLGAAPSYELLSAASALADVAKACCFEDAEDPFVYQITLRAEQVSEARAVCSMVLIWITASLQRTCLSPFPFGLSSRLVCLRGMRRPCGNVFLCNCWRPPVRFLRP